MFGKSIFQSVLERLKAENEDLAADTTAVAAGVRGLNAGFAVETSATTAGSNAVQRAYAETADAETTSSVAYHDIPPVIAKVVPAHLQRTTHAEIADDLALDPADTASALAEKRRVFASLNHPDRHPPEWAVAANRRMTIANMLVDEALAWRKRQAEQAFQAGAETLRRRTTRQKQ